MRCSSAELALICAGALGLSAIPRDQNEQPPCRLALNADSWGLTASFPAAKSGSIRISKIATSYNTPPARLAGSGTEQDFPWALCHSGEYGHETNWTSETG